MAVGVASLGAAQKTFLWKASRAGHTFYVAGSIHVLTPAHYPLPEAFNTAYKDADLLVEEIDLGELLQPEGQMLFLTKGMLPTSTSLEQVLAPATMASVNGRLGTLGLPMDPLRRFKPWMLAITLMALEWQKAGFDPELGLDKHFYDRAQTDHKGVQGLETAAFQVSRFDELTWPEQDRMLASTLSDLDAEVAAATGLADAWRNGDAAAVERVVLAELRKEPQMYQRLLVERNRNWLPKIEALASRSGHALVIVGAAHIVGPDGVLAGLQAKGFTLTQQ